MKKLVIALLTSTAIAGPASAGSFCFDQRVQNAYLKMLRDAGGGHEPQKSKLQVAVLDAYRNQEIKKRLSQGVTNSQLNTTVMMDNFEHLTPRYELRMDAQERIVEYSDHPGWPLQLKCKATLKETLHLVELDAPATSTVSVEFGIGKDSLDSVFIIMERTGDFPPATKAEAVMKEDPINPILRDNEEYRDLPESTTLLGSKSTTTHLMRGDDPRG